jgi:murein DD-endopeptidase MepM/ murein hydrolase activator NlpD
MNILIAPVPVKKGFKGNFLEKRPNEIHPGVDIGAKVGTPVLAPMDGEVVYTDTNGPKCGATIDIDYKNGFWSRFCHMSRIDVKKGEIVKQGETVGLSGGEPGTWGAGNSQGPHLHFTLKKDGKKVDPLEYIDKTVPYPTDNFVKDDSDEDLTKIDAKGLLDKMNPEERKKFNLNLLSLLGMSESKNKEDILIEATRIKELMK